MPADVNAAQRARRRAARVPGLLPPDVLLLTSSEVALRLMIGVRTLFRWVERGEFPQPIRFNRKVIRWPAAQVREWLERRAVPSAIK